MTSLQKMEEIPSAGSENERAALLFMLEDLERSRQQIKRAHEEWIAALDSLRDPVFMHDQDFRIMRCNRAYAQLAEMPIREVIGKVYWEVFPKREGPLPHCGDLMRHAIQDECEPEDVALEDGRTFISKSFPVKDEAGNYLYSLHVMEDATERKKLDELIRKSEERFRSTFEQAAVGMAHVNLDGRWLRVNQRLCEMVGYPCEELLQKTFQDITHPDDLETDLAYVRQVLTGEIQTYSMEKRYFRKDRSILWINLTVSLVHKADGAPDYFISVIEDICARKTAEQQLQQNSRALRTLSAGNQSLIHAENEAELLEAMCHAAVDVGGYSAAWVGFARDDAQYTIEPMAQAGIDPALLKAQTLTWAESHHGDGVRSAGLAIRTAKTQITQNIAEEHLQSDLQMLARLQGYASGIALPLMANGRAFGVFCLYGSQNYIFDEREVALLEEMASDLAFGIETLRIKIAHSRHEQLMQQSLLETIEAVAAMVEMRDPYTAGHQRRVAALAKAIAHELGLPEDICQGIYLAGTVHDVGKLNIPAEILSKPGRLSDIEFQYIKTHPQAGYEILKNIHFPWPLADIVFQHHERLDGSGYPQGLQDGKIAEGAKILSVADAVEAIASHRPYRPGLGMEAALEEIASKRGTQFDAAVVDACVRLIREQRYII